MVFGFNECIAIAGWTALIFMQWTQYSASSDRSWYTKRKTKSMPPAWVFPLAWTLLYSALVVMMFFFTQDTLADSWQIILGFTLFLIHIALNKEWSVYFWDRANPTAAFYILVFGMLPTSLILYVPFIVDNQTIHYYIPVIMVTIYNAWLLYAAYLNYKWIEIEEKN